MAAHDSTDFPLDEKTWEKVARKLALAPQQKRIVKGVLKDMTDEEIADSIRIGVPTVRTYLGRVFAKVGVNSRLALAVRVFTIAREV